MGWRPLPSDEHRPPVHVGTSVERVLRHLGAPTSDALETVFGRWATLVGPKIAAHAAPIGVATGRLTVRADDPAWANQLRWLEQELLDRLASALGPGVVTAIDVRVGPADAGRPGYQRPARRRSGPARGR
jgi:predicted nucleic acid-binding Zn ribbon protein